MSIAGSVPDQTSPGGPPHSPLRGFAAAAAISLVALLVRLALDRYLAGVQFITFFPAVMLVSYVWGVRPGLLAAFLCGIGAWYALMPPIFSFRFDDPVQGYTLLFYFAVAVSMAVVVGTVRETRAILASNERRLRQVLDSMKEGFVLLDRDLRVVEINAESLRLERRRREDIIGKTHPEAWPDAAARELAELYRQSMVDGRPIARNHRYSWPDGRATWLEMRAYPSGEGIAIFYRDVTARVQAELALVDSDRRLNAVLDNASVAIFLMDERQHCAYMNAAAERLTGYSFEETQGQPLHDVIHHTRPDGTPFPLHECAIDRAFPEEANVRGEEVFVHKSGQFYPVAFTASPIREESGRTIGTIIEVRDISAEKAAEAHQRLLINELNHRVKNTLAIVQGVAGQTFRGDGIAAEARQAFDGRLAALAAAHDILTERNWEAASLHQVVRETAGLGCGADGARVAVEGPDLRIAPQTAVSLAMALHELCTNAMKYGALTGEDGRVEVRWQVSNGDAGSERRLRLVWSESGGPPVSEPTRRGFGTRMIERGLAGELGGTAMVEFRPEGVVCTVEAPLPTV